MLSARTGLCSLSPLTRVAPWRPPPGYDGLRSKNLNLFRKLNAVVFPISYADKFYADCMAAGRVTQLGAPPVAPLAARRLTRAPFRPAYSLPTDVLVGGIACRYEKAGDKGGKVLYVMSLGVLAPYRGRGVGQRLLLRALAEAHRDASVEEVYLHVQAR